MDKTFLSIIICACNSRLYIEEALDSIFYQGRDDIEVIVVDNGSSDNAQDFIRSHYPEVFLIRNEENKGASFARNQGIRQTSSEYILFMDSDAYLEKGFFVGLKDLLKDLPGNIGGISPKIIDVDSQRIFSCGLSVSSIYRVHDLGKGKAKDALGLSFSVDGPNTCCGIFRRSALEAIAQEGRYFDEDFFFLFEDADLALRLKNKGYNSLFEPRLLSYHYGKSFSASRQKRRYLCFRNRLYMILKNNSGPRRFGFFLRSAFYDLPRTIHLAFTNRYFFRIFRDLKVKDG